MKQSKISDFLITHTISPFIFGVSPSYFGLKDKGGKYLKVQ